MTQFQIILVHTMNPPWDNFGCQTKLSTIATIVRQNLLLSNANIIVGYVVRFFVQNAVVFSYLEDISMSLVLSEFVTPVTKILKKILPKCCQVFFFTYYCVTPFKNQKLMFIIETVFRIIFDWVIFDCCFQLKLVWKSTEKKEMKS